MNTDILKAAISKRYENVIADENMRDVKAAKTAYDAREYFRKALLDLATEDSELTGRERVMFMALTNKYFFK